MGSGQGWRGNKMVSGMEVANKELILTTPFQKTTRGHTTKWVGTKYKTQYTEIMFNAIQDYGTHCCRTLQGLEA